MPTWLQSSGRGRGLFQPQPHCPLLHPLWRRCLSCSGLWDRDRHRHLGGWDPRWPQGPAFSTCSIGTMLLPHCGPRPSRPLLDPFCISSCKAAPGVLLSHSHVSKWLSASAYQEINSSGRAAAISPLTGQTDHLLPLRLNHQPDQKVLLKPTAAIRANFFLHAQGGRPRKENGRIFNTAEQEAAP